MAKKRVRQKHYFLLRITKQQMVRIGVPVSDAKETVTLNRTVANVLAGTEGMSISCANADCALKSGAFPHPVYMAAFSDNRAFVVDKLDKRGVPSHCVRYAHNEGEFQKEYDPKGKQRLAKTSGVEKAFVLTPPPKRRAAGTGVSHGGTSGPNGRAKRRELQGEVARALRAGFNFAHPSQKSA